MPKSFGIFRLFFKTPLHLSSGKNEVYENSYEIIHSDTLKSAIFATGIQLYGLNGMDKSFLESFTISSAFPFKKEECFFPKPMSRLSLVFRKEEKDVTEQQEAKAAKKIKRLSFLGASYFEAVINGQEKIVLDKNVLHDGKFISELLSPNEEIMKADIQERVSLRHLNDSDNEEKDARPYQFDRIYFGKDAGLFFLIKTQNTAIQKKVESILRLLGDNGIGTDRNVGNGLFDADYKSDLRLNIPDQAQRQMSLSLFLPERGELDNNLLAESAFTIKKRGGYVASPGKQSHSVYRKRSIYMFTEGSVFPNTPLYGKVEDIAPQIMDGAHPVWRDGKALFIPMV